MRVMFFGSGAFGLPTLEWLADSHEVTAVVSQPDRPAGRKRSLTPTPVSSVAARLGVPLHRFEDVNAASSMAVLHGVDAEAWIVIAYGQKLGRPLLQDRFAINLHGSLLPRWRGASPIHQAIMAGDIETGLSVITVADQMDAGDVLDQVSIPVSPSDTTADVHEALAALGPSVISGVLSQAADGNLKPAAQDPSLVTRASKLTRQDAALVDGMSVDALRCCINACSPWPGCDAIVGGDPLRLLRAAPSAMPGQDGMINSEGVLGWSGQTVHILEVQPPGRRCMSFVDWARGRPFQWPVQFTPVAMS